MIVEAPKCEREWSWAWLTTSTWPILKKTFWLELSNFPQKSLHFGVNSAWGVSQPTDTTRSVFEQNPLARQLPSIRSGRLCEETFGIHLLISLLIIFLWNSLQNGVILEWFFGKITISQNSTLISQPCLEHFWSNQFSTSNNRWFSPKNSISRLINHWKSLHFG